VSAHRSASSTELGQQTSATVHARPAMSAKRPKSFAAMRSILRAVGYAAADGAHRGRLCG